MSYIYSFYLVLIFLMLYNYQHDSNYLYLKTLSYQYPLLRQIILYYLIFLLISMMPLIHQKLFHIYLDQYYYSFLIDENYRYILQGYLYLLDQDLLYKNLFSLILLNYYSHHYEILLVLFHYYHTLILLDQEYYLDFLNRY